MSLFRIGVYWIGGASSSLSEDSQSRVDSNFQKSGAARGNRTPDPIITNDVLYQLSYCGEKVGSS